MAENREHRLVGVPAVAALADLGFASVASGVIARRRPVLGLLERTGADSRAIERVRQLRREFGSGPVELVVPGRRIVVILDPSDVERVLADAPTPFTPPIGRSGPRCGSSSRTASCCPTVRSARNAES